MNTEPTVPLDPPAAEGVPTEDLAPLDPPAAEGLTTEVPEQPPAFAQPPAFEPLVFDRPAEAPTPPPAPRIRWAGIVWGFVFAAIAVVSLWVLVAASRREAISEWAKTLSPESVSPGVVLGILVLGFGTLLIIVGGIALLRRVSTRRA